MESLGIYQKCNHRKYVGIRQWNPLAIRHCQNEGPIDNESNFGERPEFAKQLQRKN